MNRPPSNEHIPADVKFRVLSVDGGGIRGLIPALFLEGLEAALGEALGETGEAAGPWRDRGIDVPRIADCFHLIAGTSTGGLPAAALTIPDGKGRPKLSAAEAASMYESDGRTIFRRPLLRRLLDPWGLVWPKYPLAQLAAVLKRPTLIGEAKLKDACTDVLITTYDAAHSGPRLFTNWGAPGAGETDAKPEEKMVDVALGTAAAPTYFDPERLGSARLIDGGVFAANPTLAGVSMALRRTEAPGPFEDPDELLVISVGTGFWEEPLDYGWGGIIGWLRPRKGGEALLEAILDGQADHATEAAHMLLNRWPKDKAWGDPTIPAEMLGGGPRFWRYQTRLPEPFAMDDVGRLPELRELGIGMAGQYEEELRRLARFLIAQGPVT